VKAVNMKILVMMRYHFRIYWMTARHKQIALTIKMFKYQVERGRFCSSQHSSLFDLIFLLYSQDSNMLSSTVTPFTISSVQECTGFRAVMSFTIQLKGPRWQNVDS
jgi:hypothetical protein